MFRSPGFERLRGGLARRRCLRYRPLPTAPEAQAARSSVSGGRQRDLAFQVDGSSSLQACPQGGWLLHATRYASPAYWIPALPILRQLDAFGHVTAERSIEVNGLRQSDSGWRLDVHLPAGWCLDCVAWRFAPERLGVVNCLQQPSNLERQPVFLWGSKVNCRLPTDLYRYLLHGELYTDDFVWPRKWKFHSEIDAQGIYVALDGLEAATCAVLYGLLKRQVLYSVMLRQAADGGWYHGEWTDLMESHYRLHNSAMSVLEAGLEEYGDESIRVALAKAASFLSTCTDHTDIGTWFLHDSLERSVEAMEDHAPADQHAVDPEPGARQVADQQAHPQYPSGRAGGPRPLRRASPVTPPTPSLCAPAARPRPACLPCARPMRCTACSTRPST